MALSAMAGASATSAMIANDAQADHNLGNTGNVGNAQAAGSGLANQRGIDFD